jgi:hypothetical protein
MNHVRQPRVAPTGGLPEARIVSRFRARLRTMARIVTVVRADRRVNPSFEKALQIPRWTSSYVVSGPALALHRNNGVERWRHQTIAAGTRELDEFIPPNNETRGSGTKSSLPLASFGSSHLNNVFTCLVYWRVRPALDRGQRRSVPLPQAAFGNAGAVRCSMPMLSIMGLLRHGTRATQHGGPRTALSIDTALLQANSSP